MLQFILERANYWAIISLMMVGLYITYESTNLIKKLVGLSVFQTSVFLFYITLGKVAGGTAPILFGRDVHGPGQVQGVDHGPGLITSTPPVPVGGAVREATVDGEGAAPAITGSGVGDSLGQDIVSGPTDVADAVLAEQGVNPITGLYEIYSNPLPHVLILTAIVVGVATLAVGLALVVRIREAYGSIESDEVRQLDIDTADAQDDDDAVGAAA